MEKEILEKKVKVSICSISKNSDSTRGKINIPKKMLNALGINEKNNMVNLKLNKRKKQIVIELSD